MCGYYSREQHGNPFYTVIFTVALELVLRVPCTVMGPKFQACLCTIISYEINEPHSLIMRGFKLL